MSSTHVFKISNKGTKDEDACLSGSDYIDHQLLDVMNLILKDYVYPW